MKDKILVTGMTGQDGSYLVEQLLKEGTHEIYGLVRRASTDNLERFKYMKKFDEVTLLEGDITDSLYIQNLLEKLQPDKIFNLAAQSHVGTSFAMPDYTFNVVAGGALNIFEASWRVCKNVRIYQASSSEMYGKPDKIPQDEETALRPISPYAIAKTAAHNLAHMYRDRGLWVSCGILHNHESERRGDNFLTQKVAKSAGNLEKIKLGNLMAVRDWGYAPEYVKGMRLLLEFNHPMDIVLATGVGHAVSDFVQKAYEVNGADWKDYVTFDQSLVRPVEAGPLIGNAALAKHYLGWKPKVDFDELVHRMVSDKTPKY